MADLTVGIVVFPGADELDVIGPYRAFAAVNAVRETIGGPIVQLELVAQKMDRLRLAFGVTIEPTTTYTDCPPLDVVIVPGGGSALEEGGRRHEQGNETTLAFVRRLADSAKVVGSVCTGALILASAGLLANRRANTHWHFRKELRELMEKRGEPIEIVRERIVWDEPFVTAGGVTSGIDLALDIVERFLGRDVRTAAVAELELETPG